jgi:hypothetical protein
VDTALTNIIQMGVLGPIVVVLCVALWRLQQQLSTVQQERVSDAQKAIERIYTLKESVDALTAAVEEIRREGSP